jgi:ATP-dependent DNA helicase MPH1
LQRNIEQTSVSRVNFGSVLCSSGSARGRDIISLQNSPSLSNPPTGHSLAWLVNHDDDLDFQVVDSSPAQHHISPLRSTSVNNDSDLEFLEDLENPTPMSPSGLRGFSTADPLLLNPCLFQPDNVIDDYHYSPVSTPSPSSSRSLQGFGKHRVDASPEDVQGSIATSTPNGQEFLKPSFPVRSVGKKPRKRTAVLGGMSSPLKLSPPRRRLRRRRSTSPCPSLAEQNSKKSDYRIPRIYNPFLDMEAIHSGDELSAGSSQVDENEREFDRAFLQGLPETQVSPSYDQTMVYKQSLLTQAPMRGKPLVFKNSHIRHRASRARPIVSSSPTMADREPDEYAIGSFVVDDDAEVVHLSSP